MNWTDTLVKFCQEYNIPIEYLADVLSDPKVVPMIRGKAFEFSVAATLSKILDTEEWKVDKPIVNSQLGLHDTDVRVIHLPSKKVLTVECKLAKNGSYRRITNNKLSGDYVNQISVKCMRSRTLGTEMVEKLAPKLGVSEKVLAVHNDQYLPSNFDVVITSIGNAFYKTNPQTKEFEWNPTFQAIQFLKTINKTSIEPKDFAFSCMYVAKSNDITISNSTGVICTRKKCNNPTNCGFIPNYPIILFEDGNKVPLTRWVPIEASQALLKTLIV